MMDWTDRHCRFLLRQYSRRVLLYTEMIVVQAVLQGDRDHLLGFDRREHPVALQIGGSEPGALAQAAAVGEAYGYDEINLNVGCPSDRVRSGDFGACLMLQPALVGRCVAAMREAVSVPVTVKCRLGVDDQDTGPALDALAQAVWAAGADALWVHARKAWLSGLSPKENREVPPLDHGRVRRLKAENPNRFIGLNGGLENVNQAVAALGPGCLDGAMFGRAAYRDPGILAPIDQHYGCGGAGPDPAAIVSAMCDHAEAHLSGGGKLNHVTRHMVGMFHGMRGARSWRQILSEEAHREGAGPEVIRRAFEAIRPALDALAA